jgi:cytochrome b6-f complex iron-sulfur subunit
MDIQDLSILKIIDEKSSRREFIVNNIKKLSLVAIGTYTLTLLDACSNSSNPTSPTGNNNATVTVDITQAGNTVLQTVGGTVAINGNDLDNSGMLIIRKSESEIIAFSRTCTHQGCTINKFVNGVSWCPCHGSKFDTSGKAIQGPASSSLKKYTASISGNIITITV